MSQNLLVEKLKFAKRELTALKTAHRRGLGGLKVFEKTLDISVPSEAQSGFWFIEVTLNFDRDFPAYPFAQIIPPTSGGPNYSSNILEGEESKNYSNGGYSLSFNLAWFYSDTMSPYPIYAYSSAAVESYTFRFWRVN